jgi:hypothetical protein
MKWMTFQQLVELPEISDNSYCSVLEIANYGEAQSEE